jgi:1-acyl-sn-glycerol-3-phosphate acyltransferase
VRELRKGQVVGIYPEGTRSPDGRLYRGKSGVARMALLANCPVIPVAVIGTRDIQPPEKRMPGVRGRAEVVYGQPLRFDRFRGKDRDRFVLRSVTDEIMYEIMMLSGQEYVDEYASKVKAQLSRAEAGAVQPPDVPSSTAPGAEGQRPTTSPEGVHVTVHTRASRPASES